MKEERRREIVPVGRNKWERHIHGKTESKWGEDNAKIYVQEAGWDDMLRKAENQEPRSEGTLEGLLVWLSEGRRETMEASGSCIKQMAKSPWWGGWDTPGMPRVTENTKQPENSA